MIESLRARFRYIWQVITEPTASEFIRLADLAEGSLLGSVASLFIGAAFILLGVAGLSGVQVDLLELAGFVVGLALGLALWSTIAFLYTRLLGGSSPRLYLAFLYLTSSVLLTLLVLAVFVAYVPWIGSLLGIGLILYSQALAVLAFHHMAGVSWLLSVLGTLATSVVSIGLFQLLGRVIFSWLAA